MTDADGGVDDFQSSCLRLRSISLIMLGNPEHCRA